ncbi:MAG: hypothetical protein ACU0DK_08185 [Pseudooceanicola sp.]
MADQVSVLGREELVRVDPDRLKAAFGRMDPDEAEEMVCRAMEELAVRLSFTERQFRQGKLAEMRKSARSLVAIADRTGMSLLARVAGDVIACADRSDDVALSAVLARLIRIGERSLTAMWDMQDHPV